MVQRYIPPLIQPWQRKLKIAGTATILSLSYYLVFWHDYSRSTFSNGTETVVTNVQRKHRQMLRRWLGDKYISDIRNPYEDALDNSFDVDILTPTPSDQPTRKESTEDLRL